jgi:hypothetical protein
VSGARANNGPEGLQVHRLADVERVIREEAEVDLLAECPGELVAEEEVEDRFCVWCAYVCEGERKKCVCVCLSLSYHTTFISPCVRPAPPTPPAPPRRSPRAWPPPPVSILYIIYVYRYVSLFGESVCVRERE